MSTDSSKSPANEPPAAGGASQLLFATIEEGSIPGVWRVLQGAPAMLLACCSRDDMVAVLGVAAEKAVRRLRRFSETCRGDAIKLPDRAFVDELRANPTSCWHEWLQTLRPVLFRAQIEDAYDRFAPKLIAYAYRRRLGSSGIGARGQVHEAFVRLLSLHGQEWDFPASWRLYLRLRRMVDAQAHGRVRRRRRRERYLRFDSQECAAATPRLAPSQEVSVFLGEVGRHLDSQGKEILILREFGFSDAEIGSLLGLHRVTAWRRRTSVLAKVAEIMNTEYRADTDEARKG